jgi:hypothetical protein
VKIRSQRLAQRIRYGDVKMILIDTLAVFYRARILRWYDRAPDVSVRMTAVEPVTSCGRSVPRVAASEASTIEVQRGEIVEPPSALAAPADRMLSDVAEAG